MDGGVFRRKPFADPAGDELRRIGCRIHGVGEARTEPGVGRPTADQDNRNIFRYAEIEIVEVALRRQKLVPHQENHRGGHRRGG